jgi:hypothetical protein
VGLCMYSLSLLGDGMVAKQQIGKHVSAATNTQTIIGELLDASYSILSVPKLKVGDQFFPEFLVNTIFPCTPQPG